MMPVNNAYPIEELIQACKDYIAKTNRRISFEYALAKDNNDNLEDAKELVKLLKAMLCHVNLIPINKIENGAFTKSSNENIMKVAYAVSYVIWRDGYKARKITEALDKYVDSNFDEKYADMIFDALFQEVDDYFSN